MGRPRFKPICVALLFPGSTWSILDEGFERRGVQTRTLCSTYTWAILFTTLITCVFWPGPSFKQQCRLVDDDARALFPTQEAPTDLGVAFHRSSKCHSRKHRDPIRAQVGKRARQVHLRPWQGMPVLVLWGDCTSGKVIQCQASNGVLISNGRCRM